MGCCSEWVNEVCQVQSCPLASSLHTADLWEADVGMSVSRGLLSQYNNAHMQTGDMHVAKHV